MATIFAAPGGYSEWVHRLKQQIHAARTRAVLAMHRELILLYWEIGNEIAERQRTEGWGAKVIDQLAADLRHEFVDMKGFSARNLKYMRAFAKAWPDPKIVQTLSAQIRWSHHCVARQIE